MKTRFALTSLMIATLTTFVIGCAPSSATASEIRNVGQNFYGIILNGNATIYLSQGETNAVRLEGYAPNTDEVTTSVSNGALVINAGQLRNVNVYVTMADINLIQINGSGVVRTTTTLNTDMLLMKVYGTGTISADIRALSVGMIINGGGKIYAGGITGDSFVKVKGSGQVISMNLDSLKQTAYMDEIQVQDKSDMKRRTHRALSLHQ